MRLLAGRFAQRWSCPPGKGHAGSTGGQPCPPRYRLKERAALSSNKRGEGRDGGRGPGSHRASPGVHKEGVRWGEPSVPTSDAQGGIVGAAGALSKKKRGFFFLEMKI